MAYKKGFFYTHHGKNGEKVAILVEGYVDQDKGVGIYRSNNALACTECQKDTCDNECDAFMWYGVDLESGYAYSWASSREDIVNWNLDDLLKARKTQVYQYLCQEFKVNTTMYLDEGIDVLYEIKRMIDGLQDAPCSMAGLDDLQECIKYVLDSAKLRYSEAMERKGTEVNKEITADYYAGLGV